ncbi:MAG: hypothetical protein WCI62_02120 [Erysipelotrichaceae bacterium]
MDTRLTKIFLALLLCFGALTTHQIFYPSYPCATDGTQVCFDAFKNHYKIEKHASLIIQVPSDEYGQAVVEYWDWYHPEFAGVVSYVLSSEATFKEDVYFTSQNYAGLIYNDVLNLDENLTKNMLMDKTPEINYNELKFIPISVEGFAFVTNVTKLNLLGLPTEDANKDGLIDSIDTWEKIFALKGMWESQNDKVFPIALNEPYSFYAFLSAGGFNIFETHQANQTGFDGIEFTESLNFVEKLASINWIKAENNASSAYTWMYDQSLIDDNFIFTLAGSWMNVNEFDLTHPTQWSVSAFPTYNGKNLNPLIKLSGFSINRNTYYPSAAHELIRILKSIKGMQLLIDHTSLVPLVNHTYMDYLEYPNSHINQFIQVFQNGYTEPIIAFEHNPSKLAFSLYYEIDLMSSIRSLWDQTLSVQQTQAQIVQNVIDQTAILDTEESGN